ncbi:MAG: SpoIIE family protein phosphatase [Chloroflexota bacterium]|nr:SpoIIE family protein phosphatase [Chloroflexota bacterium]
MAGRLGALRGWQRWNERERGAETDMRLRGVTLHVARVLWLAGVALAVGLFVWALPSYVDALYREAVAVGGRGGMPISTTLYVGLRAGLAVALLLAFAVPALLIVWRKSDEWLGLFISLTGFLYGAYITLPLDTLPSANPWLYALANLVQVGGWWSAVLFFYLFPDGRLVPRWTRALVVASAAWGLLWLLFPQSRFNHANPYTLPLPNVLIHLAWFVSGLLAQRARYRLTPDPVQRQQTRWFVLSLQVVVVTYPIPVLLPRLLSALGLAQPGDLLYIVTGEPLYALILLGLPSLLTFSILRYRLWDIDVLINRTLVYGSLTVLLGSFYGGSILLLQALLHRVAQQESVLAVAASTLALTALFNPARRRVQRAVDRRFYREKYDAQQALAQFSATLRDDSSADLSWLGHQLVALVEQILAPTHTALWLLTPAGFQRQVAVGSQSQSVTVGLGDPLITQLRQATHPMAVDAGALVSPALQQFEADAIHLLVPLVSQGVLVGFLSLGAKRGEQGYSRDDQALLGSLAMQVGAELRVAQLVHEREDEARVLERLEQELRVAHFIQQALLPQQMPVPMGWQVATQYRPARAVGGDFFDFIALSDGRLALVIGDVTDKGVPAALMMASTRAILAGCAERWMEPGAVLQAANERLYPQMPQRMFATCFYALLDPVSGRLRYANAGHNLPLQWGEGGVAELRATGLPLGLFPDAQYGEHEITLQPGDSLLLYSDGLVEAHNAQGEMFGTSRLRMLLAESRGSNSDVLDTLLAALTTFTGEGREQEDDVTLVMLQHQYHAHDGGVEQ